MTGDREMSAHYWAVVQDLERQLDSMNATLEVLTKAAQFYSERAIRDNPKSIATSDPTGEPHG